MAKNNYQKVMKKIEENDIKFIKLWFTDILGFLKRFGMKLEKS
jgi:glutamine synthetase